VSLSKGLPKQTVTPSAGIVQFGPGILVVPEVHEGSCFFIEIVGPVRIGQTRCDHNEARRFDGTKDSESPLITNSYQPIQWVIAGVSLSTTLIAGIDD
jgi:hypothetical protein